MQHRFGGQDDADVVGDLVACRAHDRIDAEVFAQRACHGL